MNGYNTYPPRSESSFKIYAMSRIHVDIRAISTKGEKDYGNDMSIF